MRSLKVHIVGWPVPQPRMTRNSRWKFIGHKVWDWREHVALSVRAAMDHECVNMITGPLSVGWDFRIKRDGRYGDLDNYIKAAKDALQHSKKWPHGGLYKNDKQIYRYLEPTRRQYVEEGQSEGGLSLLVRWEETQ